MAGMKSSSPNSADDVLNPFIHSRKPLPDENIHPTAVYAVS